MTLSTQVAHLVAENKLFEAESLVMTSLSEGETKETCYEVLASIYAAKRDFGECLRALDLAGTDQQSAIFLLAQMGFYGEAALRLEKLQSQKREKPDKKESDLSASILVSQNLAKNLVVVGEKANASKKTDIAEQCFRLSLQLHKTPEAYLSLAELCWLSSKKQESLDVLWNAKNHFPNTPAVYTKLGYYLLLQGNKRGAQEALLKARALGDESSFCESLFLWSEGK
jgi:tetratricopeptide (TPR) repeat protein